ncbi:hypothetical protein ETQ85_24385 [Zoogloea oleivorans]|uniref:Uncharacterized protein n=1 Tax=Zoogloea oleivorans TaxID=1552750 RepID=A0A6C2CBR6_9RHOO|nr:hypothetical protein [Zoogloea oleivorans]TYC51427.1 hypothetical protein ETQ85_24385 [Zoogloea oleivorans]
MLGSDQLPLAHEFEHEDDRDELDPYIDGVVPTPMTPEERGFALGMLIGNLRRIHAAYDDDGEDLSALPAKAADEIERLLAQMQKVEEYDEAMSELDKIGIPRSDGSGPTFTLRGRMLRFLIRMTSPSGANATDHHNCEPDNWAHKALLLMDEAESLVRFASVNMPDADRYTKAAKAFWDVCGMLADERGEIATLKRKIMLSPPLTSSERIEHDQRADMGKA